MTRSAAAIREGGPAAGPAPSMERTNQASRLLQASRDVVNRSLSSNSDTFMRQVKQTSAQ
ncbi:MAG TPA: hypothetical protein VKT77_11595 [Chthonomonadaceae bacterium]|nr:hypothetical protein [Chthonomonadaceae bacterium]